METSELTLFSAMCESFCTAVEKARAEADVLDRYVCAGEIRRTVVFGI